MMTHPIADIPKCSKIRHNKEQEDYIKRCNPTQEHNDQGKKHQRHTEFNSLQGPALVSPCQPLNVNNLPRVPPPLYLVSTIEPELVEESGRTHVNFIDKFHNTVSPGEALNSAIATSMATDMGPLKENFPLCQKMKLWQPHGSQTIRGQNPQFSVEGVRHVNKKDLNNFENLRNTSSHEDQYGNNNILFADYSKNGSQQQQQRQELLTDCSTKYVSPPPLIPQLREEKLHQHIPKHGLLTLTTTMTPVSKPMPLPPPLMHTPSVTKEKYCNSGAIVPLDIQDAAALLCFLKASSASSSSPQVPTQQKQTSSTLSPTSTERGEESSPSLVQYEQPYQTSTQGLTDQEIMDTMTYRKESRLHLRRNKNNRCYQTLSPVQRDEKDAKKPTVCGACSTSSFSSDCDTSLTVHKNKSTAPTNTHHPTRLSLLNDSEELNSLHCFVRSDLLEIFVVPPPSSSPLKKGGKSKQQQQRGRRRKRQSNRILSSHEDSREECGGDDDGDYEDGSDLEDPSPQQERKHLHNQNLYDEEEATTNFGTCSTAATANNNTTTSTRLFPGRVGLRCVHCAHIPRTRRPKRKRVMLSSSPDENEHDYEEPGNNNHYDKDEIGTSNTKHPADNSSNNNNNKSTAKPTTTTPRAAMSLFYPKSLADLYRAVCTWQRVHFRACPHVPQSVREEYNYRKDSDRTRGKTKYWAKSGRAIGLVDVEGFHGRGGLRFVEDCCEKNDDDDDDDYDDEGLLL